MPEQFTATHTLEGENPAAEGLVRLLFLQTTSVFERYGGIEYYLDDLQTDLGKLLGDTQVSAILPLRSQPLLEAQKHYQVYPVRFARNGFLGKLQNRFSRRMWNRALQRIRAARPTHLVCGHVHLSPFVYLLSLRTGIPFLTCTYGIECWGDLRWAEEYALAQSERILTISEWTKRILRKRGYPSHQIHVVHPRLPTEFESLPSPAPKNTKGRPLRLITVSRLSAEERYKGHDHVLQALHRIAVAERELPFEYWIVGDGTDLPRLKALANKLELGQAVQFMRPVESRRELISYYRECDVFVMPSRFGKWDGRWRGEGFGIVYLEAAACGLPSIAYNCGGATDIIQHQHTGILVEPDNTAELARELWTLHLQRHRIHQYGLEAYRDTMQRFTRPAIRKEILDWLRSMAPEQPEE